MQISQISKPAMGNIISSPANHTKNSALKSIPNDTFTKSVSFTGGHDKRFQEILNLEDLPEYKESKDFKKPLLGFIGKSQAQQACEYNSSKEIQQKTLKCIQDVRKYIKAQGKEGIVKSNIDIADAYIEYENGLTVYVCEPHRMYAKEYDPLKYMRIGLKDSDENICLKAYSKECDHLLLDVLEEMRGLI